MKTIAYILALLLVLVLLLLSAPARADEPINRTPTLVGMWNTPSRWMYPQFARAYFRDMYEHGMRTCSGGQAAGFYNPHVVPNRVQDHVGMDSGQLPGDLIATAMQIDMMVEEGVTGPGQALIILSMPPEDIVKCINYAQHPDQWPELMLHNVDEPPASKCKQVRALTSRCRAFDISLRTGVQIASWSLEQPAPDPNDGNLASWLDMWMVRACTWNDRLEEQAFRYNAELWGYWSQKRSPDHDRYLAGLWCWRHNPKQFLFWIYTDSAYTGISPTGVETRGIADWFYVVRPSVNGPVSTPSWEAIHEGTHDLTLLHALEDSGRGGQWLEDLRASVPYPMPYPPRPAPRSDFDEIRKEIKKRLGRKQFNRVLADE